MDGGGGDGDRDEGGERDEDGDRGSLVGSPTGAWEGTPVFLILTRHITCSEPWWPSQGGWLLASGTQKAHSSSWSWSTQTEQGPS